MKVKKLEIESKILGQNVCHVEEISDGKAFIKEEASIVSKFKPYYIQCSIDSSDLKTIHAMEEDGFRFVEFRFKKLLDINTFRKIDALAFYPYGIKLIADEADFRKAKLLVKESSPDDRFSRDPVIPKELSKKRLQYYLKKSLDNSPDEFICGLFNKNTNELLAIKTGEIKNSDEVTFFHTYLEKNLDKEKYTYMIDALLISQFIEKGIQFFYAISSGLNLMEMDLHISDLKYKIVSASVILRKIYL